MDFRLERGSVDDLIRNLSGVGQKQVPFAAAVAVNKTAREVISHIKERMEVVFDRPTPFTKNAFELRPAATKTNAEATVAEKSMQGRRHYLKVQEAGGPREQTGLEKLLSLKAAWSGVIQSVIPATGSPFEAARLDRYGNWSSGERNQLLSGLGAQREASTNTTDKSRKRSKTRATYFVPKHGLAPGVYRRKAKGDIPVRVLKFSDKVPQYQKRLGFKEGVEAIFAQRIGVNFADALAKALSTAR
ncbi:hypothetical protein M3484_20860 [Pseudomonas sp. GX19020]|uniref:hypothetical protein n=1 Tax=Pseudomonas sp. GX19020 TaxID=2942277 RepID=UPI0020185748|nr:hypothetical protein [Pseudomonas sp. GX19020]MCL4069012.1 hypothetical protein [Pseudomonas sp. GX19020]